MCCCICIFVSLHFAYRSISSCAYNAMVLLLCNIRHIILTKNRHQAIPVCIAKGRHWDQPNLLDVFTYAAKLIEEEMKEETVHWMTKQRRRRSRCIIYFSQRRRSFVIIVIFIECCYLRGLLLHSSRMRICAP